MLMPKRTKHRKMMKGRMTGKAYRGSQISFGEFGLQALEPAWVNSRQIEAARRSITNYLKRGGKVWIRIFPVELELPVSLMSTTASASVLRTEVTWVKVMRRSPGSERPKSIHRPSLRLLQQRHHSRQDRNRNAGQATDQRDFELGLLRLRGLHSAAQCGDLALDERDPRK